MVQKHFALTEKNSKNLRKYEEKFHSTRQWTGKKALDEFFEEVGF